MSPSRLYRGRIIRVPTYNSVEADLDLTLGVFIRKLVIIDGLDEQLAGNRWTEAQHCLVVLCGGETVYLYTDPSRRDGHIAGRIFVPRYNVRNVPDYCVADSASVPDLEAPMVEVLPAMRWALSMGWDGKRLRATLKGNDRG